MTSSKARLLPEVFFTQAEGIHPVVTEPGEEYDAGDARQRRRRERERTITPGTAMVRGAGRRAGRRTATGVYATTTRATTGASASTGRRAVKIFRRRRGCSSCGRASRGGGSGTLRLRPCRSDDVVRGRVEGL